MLVVNNVPSFICCQVSNNSWSFSAIGKTKGFYLSLLICQLVGVTAEAYRCVWARLMHHTCLVWEVYYRNSHRGGGDRSIQAQPGIIAYLPLPATVSIFSLTPQALSVMEQSKWILQLALQKRWFSLCLLSSEFSSHSFQCFLSAWATASKPLPSSLLRVHLCHLESSLVGKATGCSSWLKGTSFYCISSLWLLFCKNSLLPK